jgi:hypothetical protein
MRKMERALPPPTLREKLPKFFHKCAQEFQDDLRYCDDPHYLRVWIQLVLTSLIAATSSCPSRSSSSTFPATNALCSSIGDTI